MNKKIPLGWSSFNDKPTKKKKKKKEPKCVIYETKEGKHCLCMLFEGMHNLPHYCKLKEAIQ